MHTLTKKETMVFLLKNITFVIAIASINKIKSIKK
jgi:hypothetical protein